MLNVYIQGRGGINEGGRNLPVSLEKNGVLPLQKSDPLSDGPQKETTEGRRASIPVAWAIRLKKKEFKSAQK